MLASRTAGSVEKWVKKFREALGLFYAYTFLQCRRYSTIVIAQSEASLRCVDRFIHTQTTSVTVLPFHFRNTEKD